MQKLVFINGNGNQIDLTAGNFGITNWSGLSNTGLNIQTQQVPFEDGAVFLDALMEQREISVTVAIYDGNNLELRYQKKRELISALNPKLGEGTLIYTNDYLSRQIKAVPQIPLFENKNSNDAGTLKASVAFSCPSPYWEDLEEIEVNFNITQQPIIENNGDVPAQIKINFVPTSDDVTNPQLINTSTDKKIMYTGELSDILNIDTNIGQKKAMLKKQSLKYSNISTEIYDIDYGNGVYVAVGTSFIFYSHDGINFNVCEKDKDRYRYVKYIKELGLFLIYGGTHIFKSTNGIDWEIAYNNSQSLTFYKAIYFNNKVMVFGNKKTILTSSDCINWTVQEQDLTSTEIYYDADIYQGELFVIKGIGSTRYLYKSSDGINFSSLSQLQRAYNNLSCSDTDETIFVYYSNNDYPVKSTDGGYSWTESYPSTTFLHKIFYSKVFKKFFAISAYGQIKYYDLQNDIWRSLDSHLPMTNDNFSLNAICDSDYLHSITIMGRNNVLLTTYNGIDFVDDSKINGPFYSLSYSDDKNTFCIGAENRIYFSKDLYNFELVKLYEPSQSYYYYSIATLYSSKQKCFIVAVEYMYGIHNERNFLAVSEDGFNWSEITLPFTNEIFTIVYNPYLDLYFIGGRNFLYKSSDLYNWTEVQLPTYSEGFEIRAIAFSEEETIFAGYFSGYNIVIKTTDGINYSAINMPSYSNYIADIIYVDSLDLFCLVSYDVKIFLLQSDIVVRTTSLEGYGHAIVYSKEWSCFFVFGNNSDSTQFIKKSFNGIDFEDVNYNIALVEKSINANKEVCFLGGESIGKIVLETTQNVINKISEDSDIGLNLQVGKNKLMIVRSEGEFSCSISYRQKYIGV